MNEKIIIIDGQKTNYSITDSGDVYSLNYNKTKKKQILKPYKDKDGYLKVNLHVNKKIKACSVARLVAIAFIPNDDPINKTQVNHINGDKEGKRNNHVENLEWISPSENIIHAYNNGLAQGLKGEKSVRTKLNNKKVKKICRDIEKGKLSLKEITRKYGIPRYILDNILYRKTWISISYKYDFSRRECDKIINKKTVIKICKDIESNKYSLQKVADMNGVKFHIVKSIFYRQTWKNISKDYDFNNFTRSRTQRR